jgi:hypothetical protein
MDSPQQREDHFPENTIPAVDAPWNTAFLAPQYPQAAPSFHPISAHGQPHGLVQDAMVSDLYPDVPLFTKTHMLVLFLVLTGTGECCWRSLVNPGLGTSRKQY